MKTLKSRGNYGPAANKEIIAVITCDDAYIAVNGTELDIRGLSPRQIQRIANQLHYALDAYGLEGC